MGSCNASHKAMRQQNTNKPVTSVPSSGSSNKKLKKQVVLPQDRHDVKVSDSKAYSPEEYAKGVVKGMWVIEEVNGKKAVGEKAPFINFVPESNKIYGNNGCNTINGKYSYAAKDSVLRFSDVITTMRLCGMEGITDQEINNALNQTAHYSLHESENGYIMRLYNNGGNLLMQLYHQNLDLLNGTWKVTAIDGNQVDIEKMKLVFDLTESKFHGNTGCNVLNGMLVTDENEPDRFSFENIGVTMMMCPEIEYQNAMLVALEDASTAKFVNRNKVNLLNSYGEEVLTLERTSDK